MTGKRDSRTKIDELLSVDSAMVDPQVSNIDTSLTSSTPMAPTSSTGTAVNVIQSSDGAATALNQTQLEEQIKQDQLHQQQLHQLQQQQQALMAQVGADPSAVNQNIQIHQFLPAVPELAKPTTKGRKFQAASEDDGVKKCSRCRVKRFNESIEQLNKYQTCHNCRTKRKVVRNPIDTSEPNTYLNFNDFIAKIKMNSSMDILEHHFKGFTDERVFKRFSIDDEIEHDTYQDVGKSIVRIYIAPLMEATGFRFPVRDYHKGGVNNKKLTFMFICSQDSDRQRKSKTPARRGANQNKLKTEHCNSKITLSYSLIDGLIQIMYHHKSHEPYKWKRHGSMKGLSVDLSDSNSSPSNSAYSDQIQTAQLQELRHAQLLQHSLPQHPHHNNPSNIQLPPLQSIPADSLPLQSSSNAANLKDHRDLLSEVQNLQSYNPANNGSNEKVSSSTTPTGSTSNSGNMDGSYTHQQQQQQQQQQHQYQYNLRHQNNNHQNSVIAAAVAAAAASQVDTGENLVNASLDAEIGGDGHHHHHDDINDVDLSKVGEENIDKELIGLTGN